VHARMHWPLPQLDQLAVRRELAKRSNAECRKIVLVGRIARHRCDPYSTRACRHVEVSPARMGPCVLNAAGEGDCGPLGQCGGAEIDFVVGQLSADAGIKSTVGFGLRESETRRGKCARKHAGECASSDVHGYSSLSKLCLHLSNPYSGACTTKNRPLQLRTC